MTTVHTIGPGFAMLGEIAECPYCGHNAMGGSIGLPCLSCRMYGYGEHIMEWVPPTNREPGVGPDGQMYFD